MDDSAVRVAIAGSGATATLGALLAYPPVIGVAACLLVRLPLFKLKTWLPDLCLTGLSMLGTFVTITDHGMGPGTAFWVGIGFGAMGSTLIEIGKNALTGALKERFQAAGRVLFGVRDPE